MIPFLEWLEADRRVRGTIYRSGSRARKLSDDFK